MVETIDNLKVGDDVWVFDKNIYDGNVTTIGHSQADVTIFPGKAYAATYSYTPCNVFPRTMAGFVELQNRAQNHVMSILLQLVSAARDLQASGPEPAQPQPEEVTA